MNTQQENIIDALNSSFANHADLTALEFSGKQISYSELDAFSKRICGYLLTEKKSEHYIAVHAVKNFQTYAAICGIIRAGKAYVPLNPKFPNARLKEIIELSGVKTVLYSGIDNCEHLKNSNEEFINTDDLQNEYPEKKITFASALPVYLLFTSGSTGKPKGVSITHEQLLSYLKNIQRYCSPAPADNCSHTFDLSFDLSVHDIFVTLLNGAALCVPGEMDLLSPSSYIKNRKITHWFSVPSVMKIMDRLRQLKENNFPLLKNVLFCGEALPVSLAEKVKSSCTASTRVINLYGPTEATIAVSGYEISTPVLEKNGKVCIGKIFDDNEFSLASAEHEEHSSGELLLCGSQVIKNYYFNPEADAKFFIKDNAGKTWYKTGDIVSADESGNLFFIGRKDAQIKLNGYRIELGEVESACVEFSSTLNAVCFLRTDGNAQFICAVLEGRRLFSNAEILDKLGKKIPVYMLPQQIVYLPNFPLNPNGKTDRNRIIEIVNSGNEQG